MAKSIIAPLSRFVTFYPVLLLSQFLFFSYFYSLTDVIPRKYLKGTELEVTLRFLFLVSIPVILQVSSIMFFRASTVFGDTLHNAEEPKYLTVSKMALTNTAEQTLIFALNILASAGLKSLTAERIALHCIVHLLSRVLFWLLYLIGAQVGFTPLRAFGFSMTLINSTLVFYANYVAFSKL